MREAASSGRRARALLLTLVLGCVGCDQAAKSAAVRFLGPAGPVELAGGALRLDLVENSGGFLSLGAKMPARLRFWMLTAGVGAALAAALAAALLAAPDLRPGTWAGMALFLGGGFGNWVDRLTTGGRVLDYAQLRAGPFATGVFNAADVAILAGMAILLASGGTRKPRVR